MKRMNSVETVEEFWAAVWKARNPVGIDDFVVDGLVITGGGIDIVSITYLQRQGSKAS